jgi:hypothetical protein
MDRDGEIAIWKSIKILLVKKKKKKPSAQTFLFQNGTQYG